MIVFLQTWRHHHSVTRGSGLNYRHICHHAVTRIHHKCTFTVWFGARDWHCRRRCYRDLVENVERHLRMGKSKKLHCASCVSRWTSCRNNAGAMRSVYSGTLD